MRYDNLDPDLLIRDYITHSEHLDKLTSTVKSIKDYLSSLVDSDGEEDEKGHRWLKVGPYMLKRQRRQGEKKINLQRAEEWARKRGVWDKVKATVEVLDEDALVAYVYDHRDEDGVEEEFQSLFDEAPVSYAFMKPVEEATYDY